MRSVLLLPRAKVQLTTYGIVMSLTEGDPAPNLAITSSDPHHSSSIHRSVRRRSGCQTDSSLYSVYAQYVRVGTGVYVTYIFQGPSLIGER